MSNYLDYKIKDKQALKDWIERKLGAPLIRVELTDDHLEDAIDEAMELFTKYVTPDRRWVALDLSTYDSNDGFILDDDVAGIFELTEGRGGSSFIGQQGTVFSMATSMANDMASNGMMSGGGNWVTYELIHQYAELTKRMTGGSYQFEYNPRTKSLKLLPDPAKQGQDGAITIGVSVIRPESQQFGEYWIRRYALALSKILLGTIRSKYSGISLTGGGQVDGASTHSEGITERDALEDELRETEARPMEFFIG